MLYTVFSTQIKNLTIHQDEESGVWFLDPDWQDAIHRNGLGDLTELEDSYITDWLDVEDILKLEVEMRNKTRGKMATVINWLYDIVEKGAKPLDTEIENEYVKEFFDYTKYRYKQEDE